MEFGMFHQFPALPGRSEKEAFDEAFAQIDAAERWGLDVMWLAELHFDPQRSVLSAPLSVASAIAARTSRIKIGIAVQVLPLCHPLRLAEEGATVDQISGGRLIFGVGRSGLPRTYEDYGVSYAESRDRFTEVLDILEQAWSRPAVCYEGKYYVFKNVSEYQSRCRIRSRRSASPLPAPIPTRRSGNVGCRFLSTPAMARLTNGCRPSANTAPLSRRPDTMAEGRCIYGCRPTSPRTRKERARSRGKA